MRDKANYRAANGCSQAGVSTVICLPSGDGLATPAAVLPLIHHRKGLVLPSTWPSTSAAPSAINPYLSIGMDGVMEWTASWNALGSTALESIAYQCSLSPAPAPSRHPPGERTNEPGAVSLQFRQRHQSPEVRTMPKCAFCDAELEPPVRALHTVYVNSFTAHRRPGLLPTLRHQGAVVTSVIIDHALDVAGLIASWRGMQSCWGLSGQGQGGAGTSRIA